MKPEDVNSSNFKVHTIIYNDGEFSVAWGHWGANTEGSMAMRYNGEAGENGYPNNRLGKPAWFLVTDELKHLFLPVLLKAKYSDKGNIIRIMSSMNGKV